MKVVNLNEKVSAIENLIFKITNKGFLKKGYTCGIVNGLRIAKAIIESKEHELVLERNEAQEISRHDIEVATNDEGGFSILVFKNGKLERFEKL